jgi:hypothetical protein
MRAFTPVFERLKKSNKRGNYPGPLIPAVYFSRNASEATFASGELATFRACLTAKNSDG